MMAMEQKPIRKLRKGDLFRLSDHENAPVWVRGEYIPEARKYSTYRYDDTNHEKLFSGDKKVYADFIF